MPDLPGLLEVNERFSIRIQAGIFEGEIWRKYLEKHLRAIPKNVYKNCQFGFTQICNNVIDHSGAEHANVLLKKGAAIEIEVQANGIGA